MGQYRKVIAAIVGLAVMIAARFGVEIDDATSQAIIEGVIAIGTAFAVWGLPNESSGGTVARSPAIVGVIALLLGCMALAGCSGTRAAYSAADGLPETAYVIAEHFAATVSEANELAEAGILVGEDLENAQELVRRTRPIMAALSVAASSYELVQNAETEADLEREINRAALALADLINAIKNATAHVPEPLPAIA